jgi:hypothetical protein
MSKEIIEKHLNGNLLVFNEKNIFEGLNIWAQNLR